KHSRRRMRPHALAAMTALVLSSFAAGAAASERVNLSGLQSADRHDRFIVKYREGSREHADPAALRRSLESAAAGARGAGQVRLEHLRRTGTGAEVVRTRQKLDRVEAEVLMRQIAADPAVEYVEVDQLLQHALTPNDPRYSQQWGYFNATGGIRADQAWDLSTGSGEVVA